MLNIYLLRHGETLYNADGNRYCGKTDIGLTEKGYQQANLVREQVKDIPFEAIYASPLQRSKITAEIVSNRKDIIIDERIIEADFGSWEGKTREEFIAQNAGLWDNWNSDPSNHRAGGTGETGLEVVSRVDGFFQEVIKKHKTGNIMIVAHNGVNRLYLAYKLGMPLQNYRKIAMENSALSLISFDEQGELTLHKLNSRG